MGRRVFDARKCLTAAPGDVAASIYHALGIDVETTLYDRQRRPMPVLPAGRVIAGVF